MLLTSYLRYDEMDIYTYLPLVFLLKQGCISALRYCPEAVASVEVVTHCPTSKQEQNIAANRKNCSKLATSQNCTSFEDFVYHCTINSYRNATLEVCAPTRTILGHCTEFNIIGGVIQDQYSAKCNKTFPKCDEHYKSSDAYKYADCYKLVQSARILQTDTTTGKNRIQTDNDHTEFLLILPIAFGVAVILGVVVFVLRRNCNIAKSDPEKTKKDQHSTKFERGHFKLLILNGNSTQHCDRSNSATNDMENDTERFESVEIKECNIAKSDPEMTKKDQRSIKFEKGPLQLLLLNGNSTLHGDISCYIPIDINNETEHFESVEIKATSSKKLNPSAAIDKEES